MSDPQEKRRHPRVRDSLALSTCCAQTGAVEEMSTTNLSLGGAHVVASRYMPVMTRVEVSLHLPGEPGIVPKPRPIKAEAVVVRVHPPAPTHGSRSFEMALFFSRMELDDRSALARYLQEQPQER